MLAMQQGGCGCTLNTPCQAGCWIAPQLSTDRWAGAGHQQGLPDVGMLRRPAWTNKTLPNSTVMNRARCPLLGACYLPPHPRPTVPGKEGQPQAGDRARSELVARTWCCLPGPSMLDFAFGEGSPHQRSLSKMPEISNCTWYLVVYLLFLRSCRRLLLY